jgi:hypothetical protein
MPREEIVSITEPSGGVTDWSAYNLTLQEIKGLLLYIAELEKEKTDLEKNTYREPTAGPNIALLLPVVLAGIRMKKCVASMFFEWNGQMCCRLSLSGWATHGPAFTRIFITPKIDKTIQLAKDFGCCHTHQFDQGKAGQFFASHAERQLLMEWWDYTEGKGKVFSCDTAIVVCDDCKEFFKKAAALLEIQIWINGDQYRAFRPQPLTNN